MNSLILNTLDEARSGAIIVHLMVRNCSNTHYFLKISGDFLETTKLRNVPGVLNALEQFSVIYYTPGTKVKP